MTKEYTFRFVDEELNGKLLTLLEKAAVEHTVDNNGVVHYSIADEDRIGNELICSIRDRQFPSWQIVDCPPEWVDSYKEYMRQRDICFVEELTDGRVSFLISDHYRPGSWKLVEPRVVQKRKAAV